MNTRRYDYIDYQQLLIQRSREALWRQVGEIKTAQAERAERERLFCAAPGQCHERAVLGAMGVAGVLFLVAAFVAGVLVGQVVCGLMQ